MFSLTWKKSKRCIIGQYSNIEYLLYDNIRYIGSVILLQNNKWEWEVENKYLGIKYSNGFENHLSLAKLKAIKALNNGDYIYPIFKNNILVKNNERDEILRILCFENIT